MDPDAPARLEDWNDTTMFTVTTNPHHDDPDRVAMTATSHTRGLARYSWTWTGGTQIAIADRAADRAADHAFDTIGVYDHDSGRIVIDSAESLAAFLTDRYRDPAEIDALEANWQANLY